MSCTSIACLYKNQVCIINMHIYITCRPVQTSPGLVVTGPGPELVQDWLSQPNDCATKQTKKWLTDGAHRGGTEDKRIDLPRLEDREGQGLLSCLQWKGRERTED